MGDREVGAAVPEAMKGVRLLPPQGAGSPYGLLIENAARGTAVVAMHEGVQLRPERRVEESRGRMTENGWMAIMLGLVMIGLTSFILALFEVPAVIIAGVIIVMVIVSWGIAAHFYDPGDYRVVETPAPPRDDRGWAARMHSLMQAKGTFEQAAGACVCGFDPLGKLIGQEVLTSETVNRLAMSRDMEWALKSGPRWAVFVIPGGWADEVRGMDADDAWARRTAWEQWCMSREVMRGE